MATLFVSYAAFLGVVRIWLHFAVQRVFSEEGPGGPPTLGQVGEAAAEVAVEGAAEVALEAPGAALRAAEVRAPAALVALPPPAPDRPLVTSPSASGAGGKSSLGGSLGGDDGEALLVLLLLAVVIIVLLAGFAFVLWQAPVILGEAFFEVVLASALILPTKRMEAEGWFLLVVRRTWIAFGLVLAVTVAFALAARSYHPEASTLGEVFQRAREQVNTTRGD